MKTKLLIALFGLLLCLGGSSCVVHRHAPKPPHKKEIPPGHAKKYVVRNLQSLMLPDIVSIFPLNFKVIIFQILWRMRNVDCFFSFLIRCFRYLVIGSRYENYVL